MTGKQRKKFLEGFDIASDKSLLKERQKTLQGILDGKFLTFLAQPPKKLRRGISSHRTKIGYL